MVRILHVIDNMNAGGMENMIMNYYRKIDKKYFQFDFLIFNKNKCFFEDEILSLGGKIYKLTSRRENIFKNRAELRKFFKVTEYSIVEFHQGITYFYPLKLAKKYNIKNRIIHNHGINRNYLKRLRLYNEIYAKNRISNLANYYFSCSKEVNNQLFSKDVINNRKIYIINNAIDVKKYKFSIENRKKIRNSLNVKDDEILVGHVGTFTIPKNHIFLIDFFKSLNQLNSKYKLLLIGCGPLKDKIISKIEDYNLKEYVIVLENRNDINEMMSAIDVFVLPSLYEGMPLVLIEAQSNGLPIVISDNIDKEICIVKDCAFLSLNKNEKEWVNEILNCKFAKDRLQSQESMLNCKYNIEKQVKVLESIYKKMENKI